MNHEERIIGFVDAIWEWYATHKRALPWRDMDIPDDTERAYRVMVSEVMLQQTQVSRVIIVFRNFLERFSSIKDLAEASNADVIMAWRGMGYNSRALRLRDAAREIVYSFSRLFEETNQPTNGKTDIHFPREMNELLSIPGLGPYTAAAIRNFAFNIPTPCIDTNIRRILHRTFVGPEMADGRWEIGDRELMKIAEAVLTAAVLPPPPNLLPRGERGNVGRSTADWHAALMDYGSLVQTKTSPKWGQCILTERGLMKATPQNWVAPIRGAAKEKLKQEPGRLVGSQYVPNRIFRGKIVEALRDASGGLSEEEIGRQICIDWNSELRPWLNSLVKKLVQDKLLKENKNRLILYV